ncbi:MAG TPA: histidine phosphatase family protein [Anaerolineales bacterium]|jgi:broad specificity phosphatase PhoE
MTQLCLVRHGETCWNVEGRWQGHSDAPLDENGINQARKVAEELAPRHFTAIYSSDLQRARITAEAIAKIQELPVIIDPRLRELNMGAWEGLLFSDIPTLYPEGWAEHQRWPVEFLYPNGESVQQLARRIVPAIASICAEYPADAQILIVSHGLSLAVFLCHVHGWPLDEAFTRIPRNATPVFLDWVPKPA